MDKLFVLRKKAENKAVGTNGKTMTKLYEVVDIREETKRWAWTQTTWGAIEVQSLTHRQNLPGTEFEHHSSPQLCWGRCLCSCFSDVISHNKQIDK